MRIDGGNVNCLCLWVTARLRDPLPRTSGHEERVVSSGSLVEREQVRSSWRGRHFRVLDLKCCARSAVVAHSWLTLICWIDVPVPSCGGGEGEIMGICRTRFQGTTTWEMTRDRQKLELETTVLQPNFQLLPVPLEVTRDATYRYRAICTLTLGSRQTGNDWSVHPLRVLGKLLG